MFRKLMVSTAMATLVASGVYAQTATEPAAPAPAEPSVTAPADAAPADGAVEAAQPSSEGHLASNLIGETVYNGTGDDAANIGDVNDLVIDGEGQVQAVVVGVGGFLGIGEKNVALEYATLDWAEENGDRWIVVSATQEQLEALPEFDTTTYEPAPAVATTDPAAAPADDTAMAPADGMAADPAAPATAEAPAVEDPAGSSVAEAPANSATGSDTMAADTEAAAPDQTETAAIDRSALTEMPAGEITAENLIGTTVYGADDANVGEIGDVVMNGDKVDSIIIDVGGFLGVGEKEVAVGLDNLAFMTDADGNRYLYTQFTKEQLDAQPAYDETTWAEKRDEQRLIIQ
ncbi:MAG: PRC-barrel domain-containing protein [Rhizobiaceae bacterium]